MCTLEGIRACFKAFGSAGRISSMKNYNACGAYTLHELVKRYLNDIQCILDRVKGLNSPWKRIICLVIFFMNCAKNVLFLNLNDQEQLVEV